jgi:hypothetical protein
MPAAPITSTYALTTTISQLAYWPLHAAREGDRAVNTHALIVGVGHAIVKVTKGGVAHCMADAYKQDSC